MPKTPESQKRASAAYRRKMRREGCVTVAVWVPIDQAPLVHAMARALREGPALIPAGASSAEVERAWQALAARMRENSAPPPVDSAPPVN